MRATSPRRAEAGFTLIELLIAMLVGVLLVGSAGAALFWGLATTGQTGGHLEQTARAQLASGWLLTDVHSAEAVRTDPACADPPGGAPVELLVGLTWGLSAEADTAVHVDWWLATDTSTGDVNVERLLCDAEGQTTLAPSVVLTDVDPGETSIGCTSPSCPAVTARWAPPDDPADRGHELTIVRRVVSDP